MWKIYGWDQTNGRHMVLLAPGESYIQRENTHALNKQQIQSECISDCRGKCNRKKQKFCNRNVYPTAACSAQRLESTKACMRNPKLRSVEG